MPFLEVYRDRKFDRDHQFWVQEASSSAVTVWRVTTNEETGDIERINGPYGIQTGFVLETLELTDRQIEQLRECAKVAKFAIGGWIAETKEDERAQQLLSYRPDVPPALSEAAARLRASDKFRTYRQTPPPGMLKLKHAVNGLPMERVRQVNGEMFLDKGQTYYWAAKRWLLSGPGQAMNIPMANIDGELYIMRGALDHFVFYGRKGRMAELVRRDSLQEGE